MIRQIAGWIRQHRMRCALACCHHRGRRRSQSQALPQGLHRVPEAFSFIFHHQLNHIPTPAARQTVPQVLCRRDPEARIVIVMERAQPHEILRPHGLELNAVVPAQVLHLHLALDPLEFLFGYPGHVVLLA